MTGNELVRLLANRINQPHVIRTYFQKVADYYYKKGQADTLKNERLANFFSFARYLNKNFNYFDNTEEGNIYKAKDGPAVFSENDIYDEWLNNR